MARPLTVQKRAPVVVQVLAVGVLTTVYLVIGDPFVAAAVQVTLAEAAWATATTFVGEDGLGPVVASAVVEVTRSAATAPKATRIASQLRFLTAVTVQPDTDDRRGTPLNGATIAFPSPFNPFWPLRLSGATLASIDPATEWMIYELAESRGPEW